MISEKINLNRINALSFGLISIVFYLMAYYSVSDLYPSSIPVHHDDYTNYSSVANGLAWTWNRPLSTWLIFILSSLGPDWLIWVVRLLTVIYIFLAWKILTMVWMPRSYWMMLAIFALSSLSTPIIAEYARYTGMLTHMLSGSLGLASVYLLFKNDRKINDGLVYYSIVLLLLSALAKEDFILFYIFSFVYVLLKSKKPIKKQVAIGLIGISVALTMVAGAKFIAASRFLGTRDEHSSYFFSASPSNVTTTVWRYLTGAGHPSMTLHGEIIAAIMILSGVVTLYLIIRDRAIPQTLYFVGAALTLIAPYSVLPNHVNAYYELIWLPFVVGAVYTALVEAMKPSALVSRRSYLVYAVFATFCVLLNVADKSGRTSIAQWYDAVGSDNSKILKYLESRKFEINVAPSVCVYGATTFSPWYMHSGQYLNTVMGLHTVWNIIIEKSSSLYPGFQLGADSSKGQVIVLDTSETNQSCLKITIAGSTQ